MKKFPLLITWLILLEIGSLQAQDLVLPANKLGASYLEIHAAEYELANQTTSDTGSSIVAGTMFFYERILSDVFTIGIKYASGLRREMDLKLGTSDVHILETASYQALEIKSYGTHHRKSGLKPFLAVSYGMLTSSSTITTNPDSANSLEEETSAVIPIKAWCIGFDYLLWKLALRLEIGQTNGSRNDLESSSSYQASYDYNASTAAAGLAYFF